MPEDERAGDEADRDDDDVSVDDEEGAAPSGERTPTDIGPDPSVSGDLPGDGGGQDDEEAPLSDLREDVERRREADTGDEFEELFTEVDVGDAAADDVWEELSESTGSATGVSVDAAAAATAESEDVHETHEVTVVEKRLCHGCPHFSDPPETRCTHEGTTIEAEVDTDHFRVVDCPIVAEREHVETSDFSADEP